MSAQIPPDTLVLVADGEQATLYRNVAKAPGTPELKQERRLTPGAFDNQGPSGARPGDQTLKQTGHATFIKELAQTLEAMLGQHKFEHLVVVADPTSLGEFREAAGKRLHAATISTLSKDLTHQTPEQIATALTKA